MRLNRLSLTNFRAFSRLEMDLDGRILILVGDNAQGKTSLMEAVYYLATFASFQAAVDRQMINFEAINEPLAVARIVGEYERSGQTHRMEVRIIQEPVLPTGSRTRKEILLDGVKKSAAEAVGQFSAVIFLPQMTRIIEGSPDDRRKFLNMALSQAVPGYARVLSDYTRVITRRNALLKMLAEQHGQPDQLIYWDDQLIMLGSEMVRARANAVRQLEELAARLHQRLTGGSENLSIQYRPAIDLENLPDGNITPESVEKSFRISLQHNREDEITRGVTLCGPHRDDLRFLCNGLDLGDFGSRGQVRTAMLSLKLAEVNWMKSMTGEWPVLLLDETLAELDLHRRADLQETLEVCDQGILTTTDLHQFTEKFMSECHVWRVTAGCVQVEEVPTAGV
ncbi:MAG: DNA replication/repair protein RecF [Leptolinea sp.]|jgi:DNA replication and repair protein RecF|nr:DNA replication/repair protein RecF [Leptolinea sp.]